LGVVGSSTLLEAVKTSAPGLDRISARKGLKTSVDLDTREDTNALEAVNEGGAVGVLLEEGLLVQDGTRDVLAKAGGSEQQSSVRLSVGLGVLDANGLEALADGLGGLINSEDTLACKNSILGFIHQNTIDSDKK
jgi:hypothetical protein